MSHVMEQWHKEILGGESVFKIALVDYEEKVAKTGTADSVI